MRFLVLGFRCFSSADKHIRRPARIDSVAEARIAAAANGEDPAIEALLQQLAEDPFDVWARSCAPSSTKRRDVGSRPRRLGKRRAQTRRRIGVRDGRAT